MKSGLELIRGLVVERGVSAVGVVVGFDVGEDDVPEDLAAGIVPIEEESAQR